MLRLRALSAFGRLSVMIPTLFLVLKTTSSPTLEELLGWAILERVLNGN